MASSPASVSFEIIAPEEVPSSKAQAKAKGKSTAKAKSRPPTTSKARVFVFLQARQNLVHRTVKELGWVRIREVASPSWSLAWVDTVDAVFYRRLRGGRHRCNQMPGMEALSRKKNLARHLNAMRDRFQKVYDIYPRTWVLPEQMSLLRDMFTSKRNRTFIIKPDARCQGRGIFLTRTMDGIDAREGQVAQRYMHRPFLIDGLKFDLRMYVLLSSVDPLRLYLLRDGLVRFCTEQYRSPSSANLDVSFAHLTNYSINKSSENFVYNEAAEDTSSGSKWTYTALEEWLKRREYDVEALWRRIADVIVKAFISAAATLRHSYRVTFPADIDGGLCFQLLGVDVMLNDSLRPYLCEINRNPSLRCDTPLDSSVKKMALQGALEIVRPLRQGCSSKASNPRLSASLRPKSLDRLSSPTSFRSWKKCHREHQQNRSRKLTVIEAKRAAATNYQCIYPSTDVLQGRLYDSLVSYNQCTFDNQFRSSSSSSSTSPPAGLEEENADTPFGLLQKIEQLSLKIDEQENAARQNHLCEQVNGTTAGGAGSERQDGEGTDVAADHGNGSSVDESGGIAPRSAEDGDNGRLSGEVTIANSAIH